VHLVLFQVALAAGEQKLQLDALMGRSQSAEGGAAPTTRSAAFRNYAVPSGDEDADVTRAPTSPLAVSFMAGAAASGMNAAGQQQQQQQAGLPLAYLAAGCMAALAFALTNSGALASVLRGA